MWRGVPSRVVPCAEPGTIRFGPVCRPKYNTADRTMSCSAKPTVPCFELAWKTRPIWPSLLAASLDFSTPAHRRMLLPAEYFWYRWEWNVPWVFFFFIHIPQVYLLAGLFRPAWISQKVYGNIIISVHLLQNSHVSKKFVNKLQGRSIDSWYSLYVPTGKIFFTVSARHCSIYVVTRAKWNVVLYNICY